MHDLKWTIPDQLIKNHIPQKPNAYYTIIIFCCIRNLYMKLCDNPCFIMFTKYWSINHFRLVHTQCLPFSERDMLCWCLCFIWYILYLFVCFFCFCFVLVGGGGGGGSYFRYFVIILFQFHIRLAYSVRLIFIFNHKTYIFAS